MVDPVKAAMEQQVPTFNGATVAFDSVNFVEHFLSNDILRQGAEQQAMVVEALSGFGVAFWDGAASQTCYWVQSCGEQHCAAAFRNRVSL